ncbi:HAMP domain-containing sensor histidine kinase [Demequina sp. SYSU T00068]|uniref:sensor histidine kinase n=1 Tax=Demequina lignilytica TaxID=3051663 RepID=UPI0026236D8F|nr:HAMP domain-containing sensor histidine kinase [Demequina sp. SYSU T00068]MDN4489984.1 HAMP domain-containing sensor histidine kinase [Demequina sp. SYSU T00068]
MTSRFRHAGAHGISVRARVLVYLLVLTAVALAVAGTTAFLIERDSLEDGVTAELTARGDDYVRWVAETEVTGVDALMRDAVARFTGTADEGAVAIIDAAARYVPASDPRLALEDDEQLIDLLWAQTSTAVEVRRAETASASYAYVAIPFLDAAGDRIAVFAIAIDEGQRVHELRETFAVYALVAIAALVAIGAFGFFTVGRLLEPIRLLDRTARRIGESDLGERVPIVGDDDLARLSRTVNAMLDRLEGAFADQRQLLDDASHELRTPLTVLRTRLELLEPRDPDQVEATRDELLAVAADMSRLVEDLVLLAKADRPEFLRLAATDLNELTESAFARMEHLGDREWVLAGSATGPAVLDAQRVTQAWLQLAANAVKFSEPGSTIRVGSARIAEDVLLWIEDHGRGIAPEDLERIAGRFVRLDPETEGAGLGLPIVRAIVEAHGGRLEIASEPGVGSTFALRLPWREG